MVSKGYKKGADFERFVSSVWESLGATVIRSAGSKGGADLIILIGNEIIFAQCQTNDYFAPAKIEALKEIARQHRGVAVLYWKGEKAEIRSKII